MISNTKKRRPVWVPRRLQTILRVVGPELFPPLVTGFALSFARAVGEYGSVVFIAGNMPMKTEIVPLLIITKLEQYDYRGATAIAVVMLIISFLLLLAINALQRWSNIGRIRSMITATGKSPHSHNNPSIPST